MEQGNSQQHPPYTEFVTPLSPGHGINTNLRGAADDQGPAYQAARHLQRTSCEPMRKLCLLSSK